MSTVLLPMKRVVELPPPATGDGVDDGVDDGCELLGAGLVGTLLLGAEGVPELPTLPAGTSCHC